MFATKDQSILLSTHGDQTQDHNPTVELEVLGRETVLGHFVAFFQSKWSLCPFQHHCTTLQQPHVF